jgi:ABC-type uncharacterized transport system permease subunit
MTMAGSFTLFFYVAAMAFALIYGGFRQRILFVFTMALAGIGFAVQTWFLAAEWVLRDYPPATNLRELFQLTAWAVLALYFAMYPLTRSRILLFFLMPLVNLCYLAGTLVPPAAAAVETKPFFFTGWFAVHIFLLVFGIAFFFVSFLYSAIFIMQDHSLRHRHAPSHLPIPSLEEAERWSGRLLMAGYPLFSLGMFSSIFYGILHGGKGDYRPGVLEGASVLAWLVLGVAGYGWLTARVHPRRRSWLVVAGAAFSVLIILGIIWH